MDNVITFGDHKKNENQSTLTSEQVQLQAQILLSQVVNAYANPIQRFDNGRLFQHFIGFMHHHNLKLAITEAKQDVS